MSTYFFFCYTGAASSVVGLGWLADGMGLLPALVLGSSLMVAVLVLLGTQAFHYARAAMRT